MDESESHTLNAAERGQKRESSIFEERRGEEKKGENTF